MDILIKGMKMPKVAGRMEAVITILKDGTAQIAISPADDGIGCWKEYPLIPIPPYGRLGDLDALCKRLRRMADNEYTPTVFANWIENHIDSIIEAEED